MPRLTMIPRSGNPINRRGRRSSVLSGATSEPFVPPYGACRKDGSSHLTLGPLRSNVTPCRPTRRPPWLDPPSRAPHRHVEAPEQQPAQQKRRDHAVIDKD